MTQQYKENALLTDQQSSTDDEKHSYEGALTSPKPDTSEQQQDDVGQEGDFVDDEAASATLDPQKPASDNKESTRQS